MAVTILAKVNGLIAILPKHSLKKGFKKNLQQKTFESKEKGRDNHPKRDNISLN